MRKTFTIAIIFILVLSGLGAAAIDFEQTDQINQQILITTWKQEKQLLIKEENEYLKLSYEDEQSLLMIPGKPIIPKVVQTFELPFGATNIHLEITPLQTTTKEITKQIQPSPSPLPLSPVEIDKQYTRKDTQLYESTELYPTEWYRYQTGVGLNEQFEHITYVTIHLYPTRYTPAQNTITIANEINIKLTYTPLEKTPFPQIAEYDLAIITPSSFSEALQPLIEHKTSYGIETILKTTEDIYNEYTGADQAEQIKYFIKDAVEQYGIKYVLLVGGLKSTIYAKARDNQNIGNSGWHVPVRYSNLKTMGDPGYPSDLYYADIYKLGGEFEDWDYDGDGIYAEWPDDSKPPEDIADLLPDVAVGRIASSDAEEVTDIVNKIITYETTTSGSEWFEKIIAITGDGFLDQWDLNIKWDTTELNNGEYTIHAQSTNEDGITGPEDVVTITIDRSAECAGSVVTFNHDDHLNPALQNGYPAPPIAEIVSVSNGDILSNTDVYYTPSEGEAYCNTLYWWANVSYVDGILTIRGKSYDPQPYGDYTNIHVWVEDSTGEIVFSDWRNNTPTFYEGEWVTGEQSVHGRGGALYYMPEHFERDLIWTSNGRFTGPQDVMDAFNKGAGFAFFSGHGSPGTWGDQYPGIPGNRQFGSVTGLSVSNLISFYPFILDTPLWPMDELANTDKPPITVVGGCHNSMFNVSLIPSALQYYTMLLGRNNWMWTYFQAVPQCWSWYLVQLPKTGAIATMGNTGLGWGWEGEYCTVGGGDGYISSEFFRQYGDHYGMEEYELLGQVYLQTQTSYINHFKDYTLPECWWYPDIGWDELDQQAVEQWVLLGDPSLKIGGYP